MDTTDTIIIDSMAPQVQNWICGEIPPSKEVADTTTEKLRVYTCDPCMTPQLQNWIIGEIPASEVVALTSLQCITRISLTLLPMTPYKTEFVHGEIPASEEVA